MVDGIELLEAAGEVAATDSAEQANDFAINLGLVAARAQADAATLELGRKAVQLNLRDEFMAGGMNKTASDDAVRTDARYIEYAERIVGLEEVAAKAKAWARYFGTRAQILLQQEAAGV